MYQFQIIQPPPFNSGGGKESYPALYTEPRTMKLYLKMNITYISKFYPTFMINFQ